MKLRFVSFIPAICWFVITTVLLVLPGPDIPQVTFLNKIYFDKWVHAGLFGGMTFLFCLPYINSFRATKKMMIFIAVLCALYGVAMEYVQEYFAFERDFDYFDMLADSVGCLLGILLSIFLLNKRLENKGVEKNKPL